MSNPIISTRVSEYDGEGWRAIPQDHGPSVIYKLTCVRLRGRWVLSFAGTALSSGSPAEGLRAATPCVVTSESDARKPRSGSFTAW